jgi:hypothetical protein
MGSIMIFETMSKRKHVMEYKEDDIPSRETIHDCLWKAWKLTPSKNNMMPYSAHVIGPDNESAKYYCWNMAAMNHLWAEQDGIRKGFHDKPASTHLNPFYEHLIYCPYLVVFTARVLKQVNEWYQFQTEKGQFFPEQIHPEYVDTIIDTTCVEVGMFANTFATLLMEEGIDASFTGCFPRKVKHWEGLDFVKYRPILMMSLGKGDIYRRDLAEKEGWSHMDRKPEFEDVVNFV